MIAPNEEMVVRAYGPVIRWGAWGAALLPPLGLIRWSADPALQSLSAPVWVCLAFLEAVLVYSAWHISRSRTTLGASTLRQTGVWDKQIPWSEVLLVRWWHWRGWEWLFAPRLYVRGTGGRVMAFYVAEPTAFAFCEGLSRQHRQSQEEQRQR